MKKLFLGLIVLGLLAAALFLGNRFSDKAALSVTSDPSGQKVLMDSKEVGTTPFFSDQFLEGESALSFGAFNQKVRLTAGALTVISWALGPSESFSAGEIVWFSSSSTGSELLVISKPAAEVLLNGKSLGESPLSKPVDPGEYVIELKQDGYITRSLKVSVRRGFRLNLSASLALNPFPAEAKALPAPAENLTLLDLSSSRALLLASPALWAKGAAFWSSRAGDQTTYLPKAKGSYHFFLTLEGKLYDARGVEVSLDSLAKTEEKRTIGYLGDSSTLSGAAAGTLNALAAKLYPAVPQVLILDTSTGFLRVRSGPGISFSELGRAAPGQKYPYLGEQGGWFKISFNGQEGWVSGDFARKL